MLLTEFKTSAKEEGLKKACLRILKVISLSIHRFFNNIPCALKGLVSESVICDINGYKMKLYLGDKGIARELYTYKKRETLTTTLMLEGKIIGKGDVVLDVGANIGYYALMESALVGSNGTVYAIEPSPPNFKVLNENIEINKPGNIQTYNLAVGDICGKAQMYISNKSNWSRLTDRGLPDYITEKIEVELVTVDNFIKDKLAPSMIRMDVEGYEINILRGMTETLKNTNIKIFVELHPHLMKMEEIEEFFNILEQNNYNIGYCFLNPCMEQNIFTEFAYNRLGEHGDYKGIFMDFDLPQARNWTLTHKFKRLPHFLFQKKQRLGR